MVKHGSLKFLTWVLLLAATVPAFSQMQILGFSMPEGKRKVTLPFELCQNLITVPVIINGKLPLRFIIDTGVRTAILSERTFSDMMGLRYTRQYTITGPGGEKLIGALVTNNVTLTLPAGNHTGITGFGHSLLVLEQDYLQLSRHLGKEVHGILGYELFSRFVVRIDYDRQEITLISPDRFRKPRRYQEIPMTVEDTKPYIQIPCTFASGRTSELKLMVDTGASHCLLLLPENDSSIEMPSRTLRSTIGRGLGGDINGRIGRLKNLQVGDWPLAGPVASFPDPSQYSDTLRSTDVFRHGTIGGEILRRFHVIFDYSAGRIYLRRNSAYRSPVDFSLSGISLQAKGIRLNSFEVSQVRRGSAGDEAGITAGDVILSINGEPVSSMTLEEINTLFNSQPKRRFELDVLHEGVRQKRKMILRDDL